MIHGSPGEFGSAELCVVGMNKTCCVWCVGSNTEITAV